MYNFRLKMAPANRMDPHHVHGMECGHDGIHICHLWCVHESPRRYDLSRHTRVPADNEDKEILDRVWRDTPIRVFEEVEEDYDQEHHFDLLFRFRPY